MRIILILLLLTTIFCSQALAQQLRKTCDPGEQDLLVQLQSAVVEISFYQETETPNLMRVTSGTGVFISPTIILTAYHVTEGELGYDWTVTTIGYSDTVYEEVSNVFEVKARLKEVLDTGLTEPISVVEIDQEVPNRMIVKPRASSLYRGDPVVSVVYRKGVLRHATGNFLPPVPKEDAELSDEPPVAIPLWFSLGDREEIDRNVIGPGASGGPVFDCEGRLYALVIGIREDFLTSPLAGLGQFAPTDLEPMYMSTAWNEPNVPGLPIPPSVADWLK